jgi:hypothetical protein
MRRKVQLVGLWCASLALSSLCGCSWEKLFPSDTSSLPNDVAVDRALRLCSLNEGEQPYHLVLEISPPAHSSASSRGVDMRALNLRAQDLRAQVEIFWLNPITYRTEIRSREFNQTRIVNDHVVEEHDTGDFYPRWIQNFVDAILDPVPEAAGLKKIPGKVPVGVHSHACISNSTASGDLPDETSMAEVCFQDAEPRLASGVNFTRSVWFDNFVPFGSQQIARTLINDLPVNFLVRGQVTLLEPLPRTDYALVTAKVFTQPTNVIQTSLVSRTAAQSLLDVAAGRSGARAGLSPTVLKEGTPTTVYIRTDRTGRVREAYRDSADQSGRQDAVVARALMLRFKPLVVGGAARQMEAPLTFPLTGALPEAAGLSH